MPRTILITGSTDGLGRGVALRAAQAGDRVILHGRSRERVEAARQLVESVSGVRPDGVVGDFADLHQVASVADQVAVLTDSIDVLISNAGIGTGYPEGRQRSESADGYELRWAVNYLAPFLLTLRLLPLVRSSQGKRVVLVASDGQAPIDFDNLMLTHDYSGEQAYCQSKLALVAFGFSLAERVPDVTVTSMHPGSFMATKIVVDDGAAVVDDLDGGIDALYRLALAPEFDGVTSQYFERNRRARALDPAYDPAMRAQLWEVSTALVQGVGVEVPQP